MKPVKINDDWTLTRITHEVNCGLCTQALTDAISHATVSGSIGSTYTLDYSEGKHAATVTRDITRYA